MDMIDGDKIKSWVKPEFIEEFEKYLENKTKSKSGDYYFFNFDTFLRKKKYLISTRD